MLWFKNDPMDVVESAMKARGWKYARLDKRTVLTGFAMPPSTCLVSIRHEEEKKALLFLFHPARAPEEVLSTVISGQAPNVRLHPAAGHATDRVYEACELLLDQNYRMVLGCWERDKSDGELRFRIAVPYHGTMITGEQVKWCLEIGVASVAHGMLQIQALLAGQGGVPPLEV